MGPEWDDDDGEDLDGADGLEPDDPDEVPVRFSDHEIAGLLLNAGG